MHPVHSVVSAAMPMLRVCSAVGKSLSLKLALAGFAMSVPVFSLRLSSSF